MADQRSDESAGGRPEVVHRHSSIDVLGAGMIAVADPNNQRSTSLDDARLPTVFSARWRAIAQVARETSGPADR